MNRFRPILFSAMFLTAMLTGSPEQAWAWQSPALQNAVINGDRDKVAEIIAGDQSLVNQEYNNQLPLQYAISRNDLAMVKLLLESGADVNQVPSSGMSAVNTAAQTGNVEILKEILNRNPDLSQNDSYQSPLENALFYQDKVEIVQMLIDAGVDPKAVNSQGQSIFMRACVGNRPEFALLLLDLGVDPKLTDNQENTPLMMAVQRGQMNPVVERLLELGCDPAQKNAQGFTALHAAASSAWNEENIATLKLIADHVSDVNLDSPQNGTPLWCAVAINRSAAVQILLDRGAEIKPSPQGYPTILMQSVTAGNATIVRLLIGVGADVNVPQQESGMTPLHIAVIGAGAEPMQGGRRPMPRPVRDGTVENQGVDPDEQDFPGVVALLLESGADPDIADANGATPLETAINLGAAEVADAIAAKTKKLSVSPADVVHQAARTGMATLLARLIEIDASVVNLQSDDGELPLVLAAGAGHTAAIQTLTSNGANVDELDDNGLSPLDAAIAGGFEKAVKVLLKAGADPLKADADGRTALHRAAWFGNTPIVSELLGRGATQTATTSGNTPLHAAAWQGHTEIAGLLIASAADKIAVVNAADNDGWTPLHKAVFRGQADIVKVLLAAGADRKANDSSGLTPADYATEAGNEQLIKILK